MPGSEEEGMEKSWQNLKSKIMREEYPIWIFYEGGSGLVALFLGTI